MKSYDHYSVWPVQISYINYVQEEKGLVGSTVQRKINSYSFQIN